jgi:hypothetical protein
LTVVARWGTKYDNRETLSLYGIVTERNFSKLLTCKALVSEDDDIDRMPSSEFVENTRRRRMDHSPCASNNHKCSRE